MVSFLNATMRSSKYGVTYRLVLGVVGQRSLAQLTSDTRLLETLFCSQIVSDRMDTNPNLVWEYLLQMEAGGGACCSS